MNTIKKTLSILLASSVLSISTGCFGEFALVRKVYDWNDSVTDNKFLKSLLFYGLNIIPVYGVAAFGDFIIFNLIEFWDGSNPISMNDGDFERQTIPHEGEEFIVEATKNQFMIYQEGMEPVYLRFDETEQSWSYVDSDGNTDKLISLHASTTGNNYLIYKENTVISLNAEHDYSQEMLQHLFSDKSLLVSK